jgi:hypothetical protein
MLAGNIGGERNLSSGDVHIVPAMQVFKCDQNIIARIDL